MRTVSLLTATWLTRARRKREERALLCVMCARSSTCVHVAPSFIGATPRLAHLEKFEKSASFPGPSPWERKGPENEVVEK